MTEGRKYINELISYGLEELSYSDAEESVKEQVIQRLKDNNNRYTYGWFIDEPIYPANAEFYDEFCDEFGLSEEDLISWAIRSINIHSTEYRIETGWEEDDWTGVLYLRNLTEDEKEELGL